MSEFEHKRRSSEELFRQHVGQAGSETTPAIVSEDIAAFATELGGEPPVVVSVIDDKYGLFGWCSDGVEEKIKHDGGKIVFGWTIWEWPKILLPAEFHAVWCDNAGNLRDITPKPANEQSIVFVPDYSFPQDFDFDSRPTNRRRAIFKGVDPSAVAEGHIKKLKPQQKIYEETRAARKGKSLLEWMAAKIPVDPLAVLIDDFINTCNRLDAKTDALSGSSSAFTPDREYMRLSVSKARQLQSIESEFGNRA